MTIPALEAKEFPLLTQAADPEVMVVAFRDYFRRRYPAWADRILHCSVDQVRYKPGKYCRYVYRLRLTDQGREFDQWFVGRMSPRGKSFRQPEHIGATGNAPWRPVDHWPVMGMVLWAFPYDPKLPQMARLVDPETAIQLAQSEPGAFGLPSDWRCEEIAIKQIKYMPRKRCVLRYDLGWRGRDGEKKHIIIYSKSYRSGQSDYVFATLLDVWERAELDGGALRLPRPLRLHQALDTIWQEACPGLPLSQRVSGGEWRDYLPQIAVALAALHTTDASHMMLQPASSPAEMIKKVRAEETDIAAFWGSYRPEIKQIVTALEERRLMLEPGLMESGSSGQTLVHGAFKVSQILVGDQGVAVVDFDAVAAGDPLYDVAEFIASLIVLRPKQGLSTQEVAGGIEAFLHAYQSRVPWPCRLDRIRWYTAIFLLAKIHSSLKGLRIQDESQYRASLALIQDDLPATFGDANRGSEAGQDAFGGDREAITIG